MIHFHPFFPTQPALTNLQRTSPPSILSTSQEQLTITMTSQRPLVGVASIIHNHAGSILMGTRTGSHGANTLQCPGGHLEGSESFADTAIREVLEETGLEVGNARFVTATNDVFGEGKHYVTIWMLCEIVGENKIPEVSFFYIRLCCWARLTRWR
jgi:ADP-ribose pyrophosphatase YjhB (NUDIX family)